MNKNLLKTAIVNSLGISVYVFLITLILKNGQIIFGNSNGIIIISAFLFLLIISVAIVGSLILVKPVTFYIDGSKKEAIKLLIYTIGILFIITLIILLILFIIK